MQEHPKSPAKKHPFSVSPAKGRRRRSRRRALFEELPQG